LSTRAFNLGIIQSANRRTLSELELSRVRRVPAGVVVVVVIIIIYLFVFLPPAFFIFLSFFCITTRANKRARPGFIRVLIR